MVDGKRSLPLTHASSSEEITKIVHADIKNIAGDGQATLTVNQNHANIMQSLEIYVYKIATDAPWLTAVFGAR